MKYHYVEVGYFVCISLREWWMYASEISREISSHLEYILKHTFTFSKPFCTSCTKTLIINTFASCILVTPLGQFLHQYCGMVWYETTAICATVRMSVSNKDFIASGKLCYVTYKFNFQPLNTIHTVVGALLMCQLMTSSHTVIVSPLLMLLEYGWCDLITPVLLLWYSDLNQYLSVI